MFLFNVMYKVKVEALTFHICLDLGARPRILSSNVGADEPTVMHMALQVKDVLPDVPLSVITRDLRKTIIINFPYYCPLN